MKKEALTVAAVSVLTAFFINFWGIPAWDARTLNSDTPLGTLEAEALRYCNRVYMNCRHTQWPTDVIHSNTISTTLREYQIYPLPLIYTVTATWEFEKKMSDLLP